MGCDSEKELDRALAVLADERCAYCGKPTEGQYAIHRDGLGKGPEVPLCNDCGSGDYPTLDEIWADLRYRHHGDGPKYFEDYMDCDPWNPLMDDRVELAEDIDRWETRGR